MDDTRAAGRHIGEYVIAAVTIAVGVGVMVGAGSITVPGSANVLGPRAFPYVVGGLMTVAGIMVIIALLRHSYGQEEGGEDVELTGRPQWLTVALLVCVLMAHVYTIYPLGWPVAGALLFGGAAVVLGARPWWRAALIAVALALAVQVVFGGLLGLSLPPGPLLSGIGFLHG